jgi:hypothetical protein
MTTDDRLRTAARELLAATEDVRWHIGGADMDEGIFDNRVHIRELIEAALGASEPARVKPKVFRTKIETPRETVTDEPAGERETRGEHPFKDEWSFQRSMPGGQPIFSDQPCFICGVPFTDHATDDPACMQCGGGERDCAVVLKWWQDFAIAQGKRAETAEARAALPAPSPDCTCEGEFIWACGPECTCFHHREERVCPGCGQEMADIPPHLHRFHLTREHRPLAKDVRDEAMTFVPTWLRDALDFWFLHPGIEAADDLRDAIAEWYLVSEEPDHD